VKLSLVVVGKLRPQYRAIADEYVKRLERYTAFQEIEVREASRAPTEAAQRREEAARLQERIVPAGRTVLLDRGGKPLSSEALATQLDRWRLDARPVSLVIGGSHGLDPALLASSDLSWSLGPLTLPHELCRVVVLEQVYRAWTILKGEPYHK
jgi:23S rRNA (pseudouridine1915-N3)-methyltransferase